MLSTETVFPWGRRAAPSLSSLCLQLQNSPPTISWGLTLGCDPEILLRFSDLPKTCPRLAQNLSKTKTQRLALETEPSAVPIPLILPTNALSTTCSDSLHCHCMHTYWRLQEQKRKAERETFITFCKLISSGWLCLLILPHLENLKIQWEKIKSLFNKGYC